MITNELTKEEYMSTFEGKMLDVTKTAVPVANIWQYVEYLTKQDIVLEYVFKKQLVEYVYENTARTFHHILLATKNKNIFVAIIVDIEKKLIKGHYVLDLEEVYGLKG
jgi:hypothetical protein